MQVLQVVHREGLARPAEPAEPAGQKRHMKRILIIFAAISITAAASAQQGPLSESYFIDKYNLAPSFAGNINSKCLFLG